MTLVHKINDQLATLDLAPLNSEQIECLRDPARIEEAAGMLQDLQDRCGVRLPFPEGEDLGVFSLEEEARDKAEEEARRFDAVSIEEMASDDGRSFGTNEFYVTGFTGPEAALAAACRPLLLTFWVTGEERMP